MNNFQKCFSGNVYIFGQGVTRCSVVVGNGKILSFGEYEEKSALPDQMIVLPGFIDKHIHGAGGEDCMRSSSALKTMSRCLAKEGVTRFLPTTMTAPVADLYHALSTMGEEIDRGDFDGAKPIGIHLEGPFIAREKCGAQPQEDILPFSKDFFEDLFLKSGKNLLQVTYAPEKNPGMTVYLAGRKIVPSIGHTVASAKEVLLAEKEGAFSVTHTYNAMTGFSHRDCGTVGGALLAEKLICELICDRKHVEDEAIRLLYKSAKGRVALVTDATEAKGLPEGTYHLGKNEIIVSGGLARLSDGTIAGSVLKMNDAVKNYKDVCNISLEEAVDAASFVPAKCLGIEDKCGSIGVGKYADFAICDQNLNIIYTVREGKTIFSA